MHTLGKISLVGAGPGDPDLLTLQALKLINNATLVIADRLISPEILDLVKCELRIARKHPGCAEKAQEEIYEWVREGIQQGHNVVRLKIGDPYLFGRGGEEMLEFRKLGVEPVVAAGVSSSYCAPMSSNIPLTHRGIANQVLISTGYGRDSTVVDVPPYSSDRTVVLLMAVGRLRDITANMTDAGYPVHTPIAIIERATTPQQRTLYGTLESIADIAEKQKARAPATIVVGEVINVLKTNVYGNGLGDGLPNPTHKEDNLIVSSEMLFPSMRQKAVESFAASRNLSRIL
eukprot:CAMPEP_0182432614 /NCGR_PEP_ID=MMETSP1167-20130531/57774_1 /TAXON_ID=2988 /ORGANISM="Mallomonas Sp, Strain CCMP3275" /LENGTH=288 /DNA_ID=CAMNT_0024620359 /DNA_START=231 /DNA_END=1097 /DNA_ORIENTATION=-